MPTTVIEGNIFTSKCQVLVNTVNCVGVMGAGIALECRLRYPEMFERYVQLCESGQIDIGKLWIYKSDRWILNFPTKKHWKYPSKIEYLEAGLEKFASTYRDRGIESIAFPLLGADKGGIPANESLAVMHKYLDDLDINIEIYKYDPSAEDDLYAATKEWLLAKGASEVARITGIRPQYVGKVLEAIERPDIAQLNQLARVKGIGIKTMESIFNASRLVDPVAEPSANGDQGALPL
jgi:O-acetyl-ADP-ribose deacetylase (regulator of RNase III)